MAHLPRYDRRESGGNTKRLLCKQEVVGSIPIGSTIPFIALAEFARAWQEEGHARGLPPRLSGTAHGPHPHRGRRAARRRGHDQRSEERRPSADGRLPVDRRAARAREHARSSRHRVDAASAAGARRRGTPSPRRAGQADADLRAGAVDHGTLRSGAPYARLGPGARAPGRPRRHRQGLAARRLRHRHTADRPALVRPGSHGRQDRARRWLCHGHCTRWVAVAVSFACALLRSAPPRT